MTAVDAMGMPEHEHPLWLSDRISLISAGVDIGSATSQVVFSTITLRRLGREMSSRYAVVGRDMHYRSPVWLTPFQRGGDLDADALRALIATGYGDAGYASSDVDTGVVVLTGEAADRRNARAIGDVVADLGGQFLSVAAGHHLEAVLAAHGNGAVARSRSSGRPVLTIDIGGGTTKLAVARDGTVVATAALHLGGRLIAFDDDGRLSRIEQAGDAVARACGLRLRIGEVIAPADVATMGRWMADRILAAVGSHPDRAPAGLWLTEPLPPVPVDAVIFSGGVGEYVYAAETMPYGDLGEAIGSALREQSARLPAALVPATARIRATVVGAAEYAVQVSGNTLFVAPPSALPMRNIRVVRPRIALPERVDVGLVAAGIQAALRAGGVLEGTEDIALALDWQGDPSYGR
ncbi:MAG TPA: ethanolamine ammonia-lyase reactivating factor EutA, partial [Micromonosporaceae bacterium]